jgi:hypothetical protein
MDLIAPRRDNFVRGTGFFQDVGRSDANALPMLSKKSVRIRHDKLSW